MSFNDWQGWIIGQEVEMFLRIPTHRMIDNLKVMGDRVDLSLNTYSVSTSYFRQDKLLSLYTMFGCRQETSIRKPRDEHPTRKSSIQLWDIPDVLISCGHETILLCQKRKPKIIYHLRKWQRNFYVIWGARGRRTEKWQATRPCSLWCASPDIVMYDIQTSVRKLC
jgi:hypothetical protein